MLFEYSNFVKCTKEEAWQLIMHIERRPEWIHFMEKCYWTEKKPGMIGSRYQEQEVFLGIPLNINYVVTKYVEHEELSSKCNMLPFYPEVDVIVKEAPGGCQCILRIEGNMNIFKLIPNFILRKQVDNLVQPLVDRFAELLESESVLRQ